MLTLDIHDNKQIFGCDFFGTRLNLNPTTFSLCHEAQAGDRILGKIEELTPETYENSISELIEANKDENAPCHNCSKGKTCTFIKRKLVFVTVCPIEICNSRCIYCTGYMGKKEYNPIPILEAFHQKNMFESDCLFDWGGGEPTLNHWFEETVEWIYQHRYKQRINTNAILFSNTAYNALKDNKASIRISVDSGSATGFEIMKGTGQYDNVWGNIKKYCEAGDEVYIKYNICNYNSDVEEIESFIRQCELAGVKNLIIDAEISAYQPQKNAGPFYFTVKEWEAAHYLKGIAERKGFKFISAHMHIQLGASMIRMVI